MSRVDNGVVEAVRKDNKALNIGGNWYSSYEGFSGISKNDVVSFEFTVKGQWKNIKGAIEKVTGGAGADDAPTLRGTSPNAEELPPHYMIARGYMNKVQVFPIPFDHPDRAIIRQNSLTNAVNMMAHGDILASIDDSGLMAEACIEVASIFEKYSTGQLEMEEAERLVAEQHTEK